MAAVQPRKATLGGTSGCGDRSAVRQRPLESSLLNSTSPQAFRLGGTSLRLPRTGEVYPTPPLGQGFADLRKLSLAPRKFKLGRSLFLSLIKRVNLNRAAFRNPIHFAMRSLWKNPKGRCSPNEPLGSCDETRALLVVSTLLTLANQTSRCIGSPEVAR